MLRMLSAEMLIGLGSMTI